MSINSITKLHVSKGMVSTLLSLSLQAWISCCNLPREWNIHIMLCDLKSRYLLVTTLASGIQFSCNGQYLVLYKEFLGDFRLHSQNCSRISRLGFPTRAGGMVLELVFCSTQNVDISLI